MKNLAKINITLVILVLAISIVTYCLVLYKMQKERISSISSAKEAETGWNEKKQLDFAQTLENKGLKKQALVAFDDYLKVAKISALEAARLFYKMGNMYMELLDYEKALYYFYKVETADPNARFKSQLDDKL